jgi:hypothetical protein
MSHKHLHKEERPHESYSIVTGKWDSGNFVQVPAPDIKLGSLVKVTVNKIPDTKENRELVYGVKAA